MKRYIAFILAMCMLFGLGTTVSAAMPSENTVQPLWDNISSAFVKLRFNDTDGLARGVVSGEEGTTKITAVLTVYKQTAAGWVFVTQASDSTTESDLSLEASFVGESGVEYKALFRVTVTANGTSESEEQTDYATCP